MWGDEKFCRLSKPKPNAQSLFQWLLTGPRTTNIPGVIVGKPAVLAAEIDWPLKAYADALAEVIALGMAVETPGYVWLPNALKQKQNKPESLNVLKGWGKTWDSLTECEHKFELYNILKAYAYGLSDAYGDAFSLAFGDAFSLAFGDAKAYSHSNTNTNTKQEQKKRPPLCPIQKIVDLYHEILPELSKCKAVPEDQIRARWKSSKAYQTEGWWWTFFDGVRKSPFLMGDNDRDWKAHLDWLTKLGNFRKVLNGAYAKGQSRATANYHKPKEPDDPDAGPPPVGLLRDTVANLAKRMDPEEAANG